MSTTIGFRPTDEDRRILAAAQREGENTADVIRRGLRLLAREQWAEQARADAERLATEDLSTEPDAW